MALTLSKKCVTEEKSTMDMEKENSRKKIDSFVDSCDYDIKEGNLDVLMYRVNQFNYKYSNLDQDVMLGLFKKIWVENNPILKWILLNMNEKTIRSAFREWILAGDAENDDNELWWRSKEKQFFDILKKYGITEYWCSKEFDPSDDFNAGKLLLPTDDPVPALELYDLYTIIEPEEYCPVIIVKGSKDSEFFSVTSENLERREVN